MKFRSEVVGNTGLLASRDTASRTDRCVFLCRAVKVNEKVTIQIENGLLSRDGHRAIGIGFTNASPLNAAWGLRHSPESCVVPLPEDLCLPGAQIEFWINYAFFVIIRASDRKKYYMKAEGLNLHEPLFVFLDFCGSMSTVRLLGSKKGDRTSCSFLPADPIGSKEQALNDNLLNLTLISDDNANSGGSALVSGLLMIEAQSSLGVFEGNPNHLFFTYDQIALQQRKYEQAGKLVAWSVIHGGPGLKALDPHLYQLMCGVQTDLTDFDWRLIPDPDVQRKAEKILACRTVEHLCALQRELGDWISDCGFPGIYGPNICIQDVPKIYSYVVRHYIYLRVSNMINQFIKGLNSCGKLWNVVQANWIDFLPIFTKTYERLSRSSFRALFEISWSAEGTKRREEEEETIYYWELVLKMIEEQETELCFEELLVFITASDEVPVLGFPEKLSIHFYQPERRGCRLPYASTCMMGLFLPRGIRSHAKLNQMLLRAVRDSNGFGKS
ncbi:hypothetical protein QTP86_000483 [Hemibagrus guttatus]|nr:hypothetical protein QTP86_000483 [Hemibagrus guttatus]